MAEQVSSLKTGIKYKDTPIGKIPVDWEVVRLGNIATEFYNGGTPDTKNRDYWNGTIPWITGADFENQKVKTIRRRITTEGVKNSSTNVVPKGNLLIVTRTGVGKVAIAPFNIAISQDITGVILDLQKASAEFVYWYLDFISGKLRLVIQGTSINGLLRDDLEEMGLPLPFIAEQKKIADILNTVDEAIEKTDQIIQKTKEVKKGLMQKLLTRGIGHKKFKETEIGEIPEEWKVGNISDYGEIVTGNTPPTSNRRYYGSEYPFVSPFDLGNRKVITKAEKYLSKEGLAVSRGIPISSVMVVCIGSTIGKTGIAGVELTTNQQVNSIICKSSDYDFVYYYATFISQKFRQLAGTQAVPIINKGNFSAVKVAIPPLSERKRIGDILASIDDEIEKESNHKEQLESLKKGLMQVLLTGKIRVSV